MKRPTRLAILISGRGSNMLAIAAACQSGAIAARVAAIISDRADAPGIAAARTLGLETTVLGSGKLRHPWDELEPQLEATLAVLQPEVIALAGFMRILSSSFVQRHLGKLLNIHPSLLPEYKGLHTHRRVLAAKDVVHGASVHFVVPELDAGPVALQARIAVRPYDDETSLSGRVQSAEHIIYPRALGWLADGRLFYSENRAWFDGRPLDAPIVEDFA